MPTITFKTRTRSVSDNATLDLVVSHRLVAGEPSPTLRVMKNPPPKGTIIVLASPLTITLTGMLNARRIPAEGLMSSRIAHHLPEYLKLNSCELGFEVVSDANIADTGLVTFFCTASRPGLSSLDIQLPHLKLLGFDMDYSWHETPSLSSLQNSGLLDNVLTPFSSRLALPYVTALNNAVERFVKSQMVNRYPRIFGSWSQQLDEEKLFISSIFTSISNISRRSSNLAFQDSYGMRLRTLKKTMLTSLTDSENRLSGYLESLDSFKPDGNQDALPDDDEAIFIHAVEQVYCLAMKRRKFKGISHPQNRLRATDDSFCDQQPLFVGFEEELHSDASDEDGLNICWRECADIGGSATSPSLSEDVFASDFDPLGMQLSYDQFPRTSSSDASRDVEPHSPDFFFTLDSLPADSDPDYMSLMAPWLEHDDIKELQSHFPGAVLSGLGSTASYFCTEGYLLSASHAESSASCNSPSNLVQNFTLAQDTSGPHVVAEDDFDYHSSYSSSLMSGNAESYGCVHSCFRQASIGLEPLLADAVHEFSSDVEFVAMEF